MVRKSTIRVDVILLLRLGVLPHLPFHQLERCRRILLARMTFLRRQLLDEISQMVLDPGFSWFVNVQRTDPEVLACTADLWHAEISVPSGSCI